MTSPWPLRALAVGLLALLAWVLRPVAGDIALGGFVVLVVAGPYERLVARLGGRRTLAAALATALLTFAVLLPVAAAAYVAATEAAAAIRSLAQTGPEGYARLVAALPSWLRALLPSLVADAPALVVGWAARAAPLASQLVRSAGALVVDLLLTLATMFYLLRDGPRLVAFLRDVSPLDGRQTDVLLDEFDAVAVALFRGDLVVALFHGASAAAGYALFGVRDVLLLGFVTAVASFVPLVGTGLVWVPIVVGLYASGHAARATGLLVFCAIVVGLGDNFLRPLVSQGRMAMPRLLLFLTLFGGLEAFGIEGLLLGPLAGSLAVAALRLSARTESPS